MRSNIKIILIVIVVLMLLIGIIVYANIGGAQMAEGTYKVIGYDKYPDAYIKVEGNGVQFYNIDLNAIYGAYQLEDYNTLVSGGYIECMEADVLANVSDLNKAFVDDSYIINYEEREGSKEGTFTYIHYCFDDSNMFGLVLEYNAFDKTIQINSPVINLLFERD